MTRNEIVAKFKKYFGLEEFFCPHIIARFGVSAWNYPSIELMEVLLWIRTKLNKPMTINSKRLGYTQRGMRCNCCEMVKSKNYAYLTTHSFGMGVDFDVQGMTADEVRTWLEAHKDELPHNIRLESNSTWVHLDIRNETDNKIVYFVG